MFFQVYFLLGGANVIFIDIEDDSKIEKYADDFKEFNDKQLQLNNQQQQLQASILEQTKQLKDSQQKLLDSAEKSSELQDKVDKIKNPKNYLYVSMRNMFDKWQNDVLMAEKDEANNKN